MVPGLAFLYSGLARRKNALSLVWAVVFSNAVTIFTWYFWGYSLAFSPNATNGFIGDLSNFGLRNVLDEPSPGSPLVPGLLYSFFQLEFCCVTVAILMGAIAERGRVMPAMVFCFFWITLVYCPVAYWVWGANGWGFKWGVLDYAVRFTSLLFLCPRISTFLSVGWMPCRNRLRCWRSCLFMGSRPSS